jgi:DNA-binding GntR family transcriptional regulator
MLDALDLEREALEAGDPVLAARHGEQFHELVVSTSKNPFLGGTLQSARLLTSTYLKRVVTQDGVAEECLDGRLRIFRAIDEGDPDLAESITREHVRTVMWKILAEAKHE